MWLSTNAREAAKSTARRTSIDSRSRSDATSVSGQASMNLPDSADYEHI